jgi:hypothetical protein
MSLHQPDDANKMVGVREGEFAALVELAEAAWSYWCDPSPDAHRGLDDALARFDFQIATPKEDE